MTITTMTSITTSNVNAQSQSVGDTQPSRVGTHDNAHRHQEKAQTQVEQ